MDRDCKPANERLGFIREIPIADAAVGSVSSVSRAVDLAGTFLLFLGPSDNLAPGLGCAGLGRAGLGGAGLWA